MKKRASIYGYMRLIRHKIVREQLPPETIAAGWALGIFIGCAVPFGMQLIIAVPLAIMMKVSKLGATIGTFITNPVSIFFIYPAQTFIVNKILFGGTLTYSKLAETQWCWGAVRKLGAEVMASFFLGGMFLAIVLTPIAYFIVKQIVVRHRRRVAAKTAETSKI
ncbi:MAG: DUF2062 domain-containing protein [Kiritimatiellae bacterium]|nr:DUF2062 domain-containing protein [Kiritimatiellia bacterium]